MALIAAIAVPVLIETAALGRLTIALPHVLAAILIPARRSLLPLLIVVSFLIGHDIPPRS